MNKVHLSTMIPLEGLSDMLILKKPAASVVGLCARNRCSQRIGLASIEVSFTVEEGKVLYFYFVIQDERSCLYLCVPLLWSSENAF